MVEFKTERQRNEWDNEASPILQILVLSMNAYAEWMWGKSIIVVTLKRTQEEQDKIYKDNSEYQLTPWTSYHQTDPCMAADLRYKPLTFDEWAVLFTVFEKVFDEFGVNLILHTPNDTRYTEHAHVELHRTLEGD